MVIAPWLHPTDVIGSASAGANVGLAARARDLQAAAQQQAADEFIAKLNQQAYQFDRNLASEHDIAASRLAQALRAQDALDVYRKGELDVRNKEATTHAAKLLAENSFEPKDFTTPGGTKMTQTSKGRWQVIPSEFKGEEVEIGGEKYVRTSPNHLQKVTPKGRTPGEWNSYITGLEKQLTDTALSDEDKATAGLELKTAREQRGNLMQPGLPKAQITPGTNYWTQPDVPAKTNWVSRLQPTNAPAASAVKTPNIPQGAIDKLKANPADLMDAFDEKYGVGAAERVLGL